MEENQLFTGRYRLLRELGRGSFGEVWLAQDEQLDNMQVAVKVYIALDDRGIEDFKKEYKNAYDLNHPNLLHANHFDICGRRPFLVMPYCPDSALSLVGRCGKETLWRFIEDISAGLAYLHNKDIVHHDIKPDNILRMGDGRFVITDFGISTKMRSTLRRNSTRSVSQNSSGGSLPYMGPEMFSSKPESVKATDIWAFGVTLYEMITGDLPFFGQGGVMQLNGAEVPELEYEDQEIVKLILACMAKNTWDRPTAEKINLSAQEQVFHFETGDNVRECSNKYGIDTVPLQDSVTTGLPTEDGEPVSNELTSAKSKEESSPIEAKKNGFKKLWLFLFSFCAIILSVILVAAYNQEKKAAKDAYSSYSSLVSEIKSALFSELNADDIVSIRQKINSLKSMETAHSKKDERYNEATSLERTLSSHIQEVFDRYVKTGDASKNSVTKAENYYKALQVINDDTIREKYLATVKKLKGIKNVIDIIIYRTKPYEDEVSYEWMDGKWIITSDNKSISSAQTDYLYCYMGIEGFEDVPETDGELYAEQKFYVKIVRPDGTLITGTTSPSGYSFSDTRSALSDYSAYNKYWLMGWGNEKKTSYSKGTYKYEVYCNGRRLFSIPITFR